MRSLSELKSGLDVTDEDIRAALAPARWLIEPGPRDRSFALVGRLAEVATPWRGRQALRVEQPEKRHR